MRGQPIGGRPGMTHEWSSFQKDIFAWVDRGSGNAVVEAVAGGAKTTTLLAALRLMKGRTWFGAFNKHIATELQSKAPSHAKVSTIHSLGFSTIRRVFKGVQLDTGKLRRIVREVMGDKREDQGARTAAENLADKVRLTLTDPTDLRALVLLMDRFDIGSAGEERWVANSMEDVIRLMVDETGSIDFTDMLYFPHHYKLKPVQQPWVCIDEAQDMNPAQRDLVLKAVTPGGRILAMGDSSQAIYGFTGADTDSIPLLVDQIEATKLPLSVCYRCPTSHLDMARKIVPHIETGPTAGAWWPHAGS